MGHCPSSYLSCKETPRAPGRDSVSYSTPAPGRGWMRWEFARGHARGGNAWLPLGTLQAVPPFPHRPLGLPVCLTLLASPDSHILGHQGAHPRCGGQRGGPHPDGHMGPVPELALFWPGGGGGRPSQGCRIQSPETARPSGAPAFFPHWLPVCRFGITVSHFPRAQGLCARGGCSSGSRG